MTREKIDRINFLARKSRNEGLTDEEKTEQTNLRNEYRAEFRNSFSDQLSRVKFVDENGNIIEKANEGNNE